jgi:hypothetical protein
MAWTVADAEISERYLNMAKAYRSQADVLKSKKLALTDPLNRLKRRLNGSR